MVIHYFGEKFFMSNIRIKLLFVFLFSLATASLAQVAEYDTAEGNSVSSCSDANDIAHCKKILNSMPVDLWGDYLETIKKNGLEVVEVDSVEMVYVKSQPEKKCRKIIKNDKCLIEYCNVGGDCNAMAKQELQLCINGNKEWIESCMNGDYPKEPKTSKVSIMPFSNYFTLFNQHSVQRTRNFLSYSKRDEKNTNLLKSFNFENKDDELIALLKDQYAKMSYINDSLIAYACRLNERIDNLINLDVGENLFSCEVALGRYNPDVIPVCSSENEGLRYKTEPLMGNAPSMNFICRNQKWEFTIDTIVVVEPVKDSVPEETVIPTPQEVVKKDSVIPEQKISTNIEPEKNKIHWVPIGVSAAVLMGGSIFAIVENSEAKSLSKKEIKNVKQLDDTKSDINAAQTKRTIGLVFAVLGAVGLGVSIAF